MSGQRAGDREEELALQMALLATAGDQAQTQQTERSKTSEKPTFEEFEVNRSKLMRQVMNSKHEMTEDELQDECKSLQKDAKWIETFLKKKCNFNIEDVRKTWKQFHDPDDNALSKPEKRIANIRDYYWSIRKCDKELKSEIQEFIKKIDSKTVSEIEKKRNKLSNIIQSCKKRFGYYGAYYKWIDTTPIVFSFNDTTNDDFINALSQIERHLPYMQLQKNAATQNPYIITFL